jgi:hypothetical protein
LNHAGIAILIDSGRSKRIDRLQLLHRDENHVSVNISLCIIEWDCQLYVIVLNYDLLREIKKSDKYVTCSSFSSRDRSQSWIQIVADARLRRLLFRYLRNKQTHLIVANCLQPWDFRFIFEQSVGLRHVVHNPTLSQLRWSISHFHVMRSQNSRLKKTLISWTVNET